MKTPPVIGFCILILASLPGYTDIVKLDSGDTVLNDSLGSSVAISGDYAAAGAPNDSGRIGQEAGAVHVFLRTPRGWVRQAKFTANDTTPGDKFGHVVKMEGDYIVVGTPWKTGIGPNSGAVYIFRREGDRWVEQQKLIPPDPEPEDRFGFSLALDGDDTLIVGAYWSNKAHTDAGSAYVYKRQGTDWALETRLHANDAGRFEFFGYAVDIDGDRAIVGAIRHGARGENAGTAYIFERTSSGWVQQAKLFGDNTTENDRFGTSVAIRGNIAVVGVPNNGLTGSAYIFEREGDTWVQRRNPVRRSMYPMDGQGGNFGQSVAIGENVVFIGADKSKIGEESVGAVYVFVPIGQFWTQEERLLTSDGRISDSVGFSIDLDGDSLIVGAPRHNAGGVSSGAAYVFQAGEEGWTQRGKLFDDDTAIEDRFGAAVAISGGTAIVGSSRDDDAGTNAGAVYIFVRQSREWPLQAKLNSDDARPGDLFGDAVAISGEIALVGASGADAAGPESGAAYIFVRRGDTWSQQAKLIGNDTAALDRFGAAVFIEGDTAIVGAHGSDTTGTDAGAAYVFVNTGGAWTQQAKLTATDAVPGDLFGFSVGLSGDSAVVGAYRATAAGPDSGAAYIFTRVGTQWRQSAKLSPKDADVGDLFGYTVAINGDTALIGAPKDDHVGVDAGSAYIFVRSETAWLEQEKLTATDAEMEDEFGIAVSLSRDRALIGAWKDNHPPLEDSDDPADHIDKGSVYAFLRSGFSWRQEARTFAPGATAFDQFGVSVSISGNFSAIGSHGNDTNGNNAGAAYIFDAQSLRFIPDDVPFAVDPTGLQLTTFGRVKETAAFQNYPNPFNPETWIPYYLAKPTSVEIIIYNAAGHQVRRLDLGFKPTGEYIAHAKAAYWDGRSDTGELVSSGVYFYRFRAGDYSATRKMIVLK